jgi:hypothetical protein
VTLARQRCEEGRREGLSTGERAELDENEIESSSDDSNLEVYTYVCSTSATSSATPTRTATGGSLPKPMWAPDRSAPRR